MSKSFRINVVVSYLERVNTNQFRAPIIGILTNLAWLYHLEYAISINHNFDYDKGEADLVYFRSTKNTKIHKKELNKIIANVFHNGLSFFDEGVEVFCQMYKFLPQYSFPSLYYRPLTYPYVELHNGSEITLCIPERDFQKLLKDVESSRDSDCLFS